MKSTKTSQPHPWYLLSYQQENMNNTVSRQTNLWYLLSYRQEIMKSKVTRQTNLFYKEPVYKNLKATMLKMIWNLAIEVQKVFISNRQIRGSDNNH